jgi:hypothetical protein
MAAVLCCVLQEVEKQQLLAERAAQQEVSQFCCRVSVLRGAGGSQQAFTPMM